MIDGKNIEELIERESKKLLPIFRESFRDQVISKVLVENRSCSDVEIERAKANSIRQHYRNKNREIPYSDVERFGRQEYTNGSNAELEDLFDGLPEKLRQVILLKIHGWSRSEIANRVGLSASTVDRRLKESIEFLRRQFAKAD